MITIDFIKYAACVPSEKYQTEHKLGLFLLSSGLEKHFKISISPGQLPCHMETNAYGKPHLKNYPGIHFNISHCDGLVACAMDTCPIGIDIEKIHPFKDSILKRVLTEEEKKFLEGFRGDSQSYMKCFYRFWTLKESRIKQCGMGLSMALTDFSFRIDLSKEPPDICCSDKSVCFYQTSVDKDYFLSICSSDKIHTPRIRFLCPDHAVTKN